MTGKMLASVCCCMMLCGGVFTEATSALEKTSSTKSEENVLTEEKIRGMFSEQERLIAKANQIIKNLNDKAIQMRLKIFTDPKHQSLYKIQASIYLKDILKWKEKIAGYEKELKILQTTFKSTIVNDKQLKGVTEGEEGGRKYIQEPGVYKAGSIRAKIAAGERLS
jgi:hypothetical protein